MTESSFDAQLLHTQYAKSDPYNALSMPVYHAAAYEFDSAEAMELAFTGKTSDYVYSRITNPTVQYFESRVQNITQAFSVTALNSGMAAISNVIFTIAKSGSNIVTSRHLFGNTYSFFASTMAAFGVETRFCDLTNSAEVEANIDANTCCVFLEIITNPQLEVVDLELISSICKQSNVPLIADTTIMPFCAFDAKRFNINIEIVSSTKYISGGATSLGGIVIDYATFDWSKNAKLSAMVPEFGNAAFTAKLRKEIHRNLGAYMTPHVAYMQTLGLETMRLRYEQASKTCKALATKLLDVEAVVSVNYCALPNNKYNALSQKQFGDYPGAMFTFNLASREACFAFLNKLTVIKRATNLFDNKTLAIHPASTIYGTFSPEQRASMNVTDNIIRMSVGLESVDDLLADILQALSA